MPEVDLIKPPALDFRTSEGTLLVPTPTFQEMMHLLESESGVYFYPRGRLVQKPKLSSSQLVNTYGIGVEKAVAQLEDYLEGQVVLDRWSDHEQRRKWRYVMEEKYGDVFKKVYADKNQVRWNRIGGVIMWLDLLAGRGLSEHPDLALKLQQIKRKFPEGVTTRVYHQIYDGKTNEEKISFVQFVIDQCIEVFQTVAPKPAETEAMLVT